jgi:cytochrome c556
LRVHEVVIGCDKAPPNGCRNKPGRVVFAGHWKNLRENLMRIASALAVAAVAVFALGATAVLAQQDAIEARMKLMKANGKEAKLAGQMIKGEKPFDLAAAKKILATFAESAEKMPDLFPPNSKTGGDTRAAPKIWEDSLDFKARFETFAKDIKAAQASVKDLATFKAAVGKMGKQDCGGCHELYRLKKS